MGGHYSCALDTDQSIQCWKKADLAANTEAPENKFVEIAIGKRHACGKTSENKTICWGDNENEKATPPDLAFKKIHAGGSHTCGILEEDSVIC